MTRYAVLLRGINVGGHRRLPMADLRDLLGRLGHTDVATFLQSGNAVLTTDRDDVEDLQREVQQAITDRFGYDVPVLARSAVDLAAVVAGNPLPDAVATPKNFHVAFLSALPAPERVAGLVAKEPFEVVGREIYLWFANGMQASTLPGDRIERLLGVRATLRNWSTVTALAELVARR